MSALRYSGELTLRVTLHDFANQYTVHIAHRGRNLDVQTVRLSSEMTLRVALDSPEAFDAAAHAALSFSEDGDVLNYSDGDAEGTGWHISRSKALAWGRVTA